MVGAEGGRNSQLGGERELVENWGHDKQQKLLRATSALLPLPRAQRRGGRKPWLPALKPGFPGSASPLPRSGPTGRAWSGLGCETGRCPQKTKGKRLRRKRNSRPWLLAFSLREGIATRPSPFPGPWLRHGNSGTLQRSGPRAADPVNGGRETARPPSFLHKRSYWKSAAGTVSAGRAPGHFPASWAGLSQGSL